MTGSSGPGGRSSASRPLAVAAVLLGVLLYWPQSASAVEMEIVTYNGFSALSTAFEKIQIIFADGRYLGLIGVMAVCGVVLAGMAAGVKAFRDGQLSIIGTLIPLFAGVVLTVAFILPREENAVIVYDRVLNRQARFNHLPIALVLVAGLLNRIETGLVEIIEDSGVEPDPYGEGAGGIRFNLLRRLTEARQPLPDKSMERTLKEYAKNCVYDLLNSYGALVTWDDLLYSPDLVDVFEQGAVNFKMTVVYTDEQSSQESCQSTWAVVRPYVTNLTNFQGSLERICTGDGFEWASAEERQVCLENLLETVAYYGGADYGEAAFLGQQTAMARILYEGLRDVEDADEVFQARVSQQAMTGGIGAFSTANEWFPIIRAVMCAVVISMVPFVFLFVATPLFGRALAVFFGLFSFVTVWGVVEVLMHSLAADYVFNMFASFRQDGFGFASIMSYPDACTKALGVFGLVRSSGMVLATLVTGIFVKVGTYELTQISGSIGSAIRERAERSASETATPLGRAELARGLAASSGEMSLLEQATWQDRARAVVTESVFGYGSLLGRTETERQAAQDLGLGGDVRRLGSFSGQNAAAGDMGQLGAVRGHFGGIPSVSKSMRLYENLGTYDLGRRVGDVQALESTVTAIKNDPAMRRLFGDNVTGYDVQRMTAVADALRRAGAFAGQSELLHMTAADWTDEKKVAQALDLNAAGASGELAWWMANGRSLMELGGRLGVDPVRFATSLRMLATGQEYFGQLRQEAAEDILKQGALSATVQKKIATAQGLPWGKALAASGFTMQANLNPDEAQRVGRFLAASGLGWVNPEWLEGGVSMHLAPNRDGSLKAVSIRTEQGFSGEEGSHFVKKEALSAPEASSMTGKDMPAGDYQSIYTQGGRLVALSGQGGMHVVTKGLVEEQRALSAPQASELLARDCPGYRGQVLMPGGSYRILRDPDTNDIVSASGEAGVFFVGKNGIDLFRYTKDGAVHEQIDPATGEIASRSQASNVLGMDTGAVRQAIVERRVSDYLKEMVDRAKVAGTPEDFLRIRRAQDELAGGISAALGVFERVSDTKDVGGGGALSLSFPGWRPGVQGATTAERDGMSPSPGQALGASPAGGRPWGFQFSGGAGLRRYYQQDWIAQDVAAKIGDHIQWLITGGKEGVDAEAFNRDMYELYKEYGTDYRGDVLLDVLEDTAKTEELLIGNGRTKVSGSAGEVARLFAGSRAGRVGSPGR